MQQSLQGKRSQLVDKKTLLPRKNHKAVGEIKSCLILESIGLLSLMKRRQSLLPVDVLIVHCVLLYQTRNKLSADPRIQESNNHLQIRLLLCQVNCYNPGHPVVLRLSRNRSFQEFQAMDYAPPKYMPISSLSEQFYTNVIHVRVIVS